MTVTINCPECETGEHEVTVERDGNYGADADGNRGGVAYFAYIEGQDCTCTLSEAQADKVEEKAIERAQEDTGPEPDFDLDFDF